jgi:hypothetical protein
VKLVVGYLATSGGADAVALGVRLARTLGADLELRIALAPDDVTTPRVTSGKFHDVLAKRGSEWLGEAMRLGAEGARLFAQAETDVAIRVRETTEKDAFEVAGRGELGRELIARLSGRRSASRRSRWPWPRRHSQFHRETRPKRHVRSAIAQARLGC